jgi:hypothetical protein
MTRTRTRVQRRRHRSSDAQAVVEMAMTIPIFIALVAYFMGLMVAVRARADVFAAASLAAQSSIAAPVDDPKVSCDYAYESMYDTLYSLHTAPPAAGLADCNGLAPGGSATWVWSAGALTPAPSSFYVISPGTGLSGATGFGCDSTQSYLPAGISHVVGTYSSGANAGNPRPGVYPSYYNGVNYPVYLGDGTGPPVVCKLTIKVDFTSPHDPLGFAVHWKPLITVTAIAVPGNTRQCNPNIPPSSCGE